MTTASFLWFLLGTFAGSLAMALAYSVRPSDADYWDVSPDPDGGGQPLPFPTMVIQSERLPWERVAA